LVAFGNGSDCENAQQVSVFLLFANIACRKNPWYPLYVDTSYIIVAKGRNLKEADGLEKNCRIRLSSRAIALGTELCGPERLMRDV